MDDVRKAFENYVNDTHQGGLSLRKQPNGLYASGNTSTAFYDFQAGRTSLQSELEAVKRERDELAAHGMMKTRALDTAMRALNCESLNARHVIHMMDSNDVDMIDGACNVIRKAVTSNPAQSLEAHDRRVRNQKAREDAELILSMRKIGEATAYKAALSDGAEAIEETIEPEE